MNVYISEHVWVGSGRSTVLWGQKERLGFERDVVNIIIITVRDKVPHIPSGCVIMQRICLAYMSYKIVQFGSAFLIFSGA